MATTSMNIRTDVEIKKQAEELFAIFGLNMTTAVNMFLRQSVRKQAIPLDLSLQPDERINRWNDPESLAALEECKILEHDPTAKSFRNIDELFADCLSGEETNR